MTDVKTIAGGPAVPSETLVQCDQVTILGDGSHERPLHTGTIPPFGPTTTTLQIHGAAGQVNSDAQSFQYPVGITVFDAVAAFAVYPLSLPIGTVIHEIRVRVRDGASGPTVLTASLQRILDAGTTSAVATSDSSSGSGAVQTLTIVDTSSVVALGSAYAVEVDTVNGPTLVAWNVFTVSVDVVLPFAPSS